MEKSLFFNTPPLPRNAIGHSVFLYKIKKKLQITLLLYSEIFSRILYLRQFFEVLISFFQTFVKILKLFYSEIY